ncbi:MAG: replication-relaxation family protein, partial [Caldilineaceae bacterium]|nr:replication-relaxation family protein [Caldilineaceae bacterium]
VVIDRLVQAGKLERPYWLTQRQLKAPTYRTKLPFIVRNNIHKYKTPDSYFALKFSGFTELAHFFFFLDMATESEKMWREKIDAYIQYRQQGHAATYFGSRNFRVLTKTVNQDRLAQMKAWTERSGGDAMFWFTKEQKIDIWQPTTLLEPIWEVATAQGVYPLTVKDGKELRLNDS